MSMMVIAWLSLFPQASVVSPAPVSLSLAFGAGVLSTLSPCGFALLSAYLTYTMKQQMEWSPDQQPSGGLALLRAGGLSLPLIAGVLLVFLGAAGVFALGGRLLVSLFPWLTVCVGAGLVLLGGWTLLTGRALSLPGLGALEAKLRPSGQARPLTQAAPRLSSVDRIQAAWVFGLGYGLASLGCALPIFFLFIGTAMTTNGVGGMILVVATYAAGMALVLLAVTVLAATMGDLLRNAVFPLLGWVQKLSSLLLIGAGIYIVVSQIHAGLW